MAKSQGTGGSRRGARGNAARAAGSVAPGRPRTNGGRAMPGTVSRDSLQTASGAFSSFGRLILERLERSVVLLDGAGGVVDLSTLGRRALERSPSILVRNGRLAFADPALDERLVRWLDGDRGADGALTVTLGSHEAFPCRVVIWPVAAPGARRDVAFLALIYGPEGSREIGLDVLTRLYGLTPAQAEVARLLFAGCTVDEAATQLAVSRNTVRTHLKQIFSKCEVRSQAELRHVLATGPRSL